MGCSFQQREWSEQSEETGQSAAGEGVNLSSWGLLERHLLRGARRSSQRLPGGQACRVQNYFKDTG